MKFIITTYFIAVCFFCLGQKKETILAVEVNFENIKDEQKQINGIVYNGSKYYSIRQGKMTTVFEPGVFDLEVKVQIPGQTMNWTKKFLQTKVTEGDTTKLEILLPDKLLRHLSLIPFKKDSGTYFPKILEDTLNCRDSKGLKQGLWYEMTNNYGNCIDELWLKYRCYEDNVLRYKLAFYFDYNLCVTGNHNLSIIRYKKDGSTIDAAFNFEITRVTTIESTSGVSSGFDHNQTTHTEMKNLLREFITADFKDENLKHIYLKKKSLSGQYYHYGENKVPSPKVNF